MSDAARKRLSDLKDELVRLESQPWGNIESWIAKATPIVRSGWPEHLDDFRTVTVEPRWVRPRPSLQELRDGIRPTASALQVADNKEKAEAAKRKIEGFLDGLLATEARTRPGSERIDPRKVFVVHGRNKAARDAMFTFLRAIGLHPLEWSEIVKETGEASPYVGRVLEIGFSIVQAVVLLMTPDDEARLREPYRAPNDPQDETELTPQPRPNVLLEAGMALGLFPNRTVIVELGRLRPVSDIGGRHVIRMDDTPQKRQELAQRLQTAGCSVNLTGTDWYTAGIFDKAIPDRDIPIERHSPVATEDNSQLDSITFAIDDWKMGRYRGNRPDDPLVILGSWADGDIRYSCKLRLRNNLPRQQVLQHPRIEFQQKEELIHSDEYPFQEADLVLPPGCWVTVDVDYGLHDRQVFEAADSAWFKAETVGDNVLHRWCIAVINYAADTLPEW